MRGLAVRALVPGLVLATLGAGCSELFDVENDAGIDAALPDQGPYNGGRLRQACNPNRPCRAGLTCIEGNCAATAGQVEGAACLIDAECADEMACGWAGLCAPRAVSAEGEGCSGNAECEAGRICVLEGGTAGNCMDASPFGVDVDRPCQRIADCAAGLVCSADRGTCQAGSLLLNPDVFPGVPCPDESGLPFGVRQALPDGAPDFYAHPFPSDARRADGHLDLSDHPVPGRALLAVDPLAEVIEMIEADNDGWALMPGIFFRFTRPVDETSLTADRVLLINLGTGERHPILWRFVADRDKYICANRLYVHPRWGDPLEPNTAYAALILNDVRSAARETPEALDALTVLLGPDAPSDQASWAVWDTFAPLRARLGAGGELTADRIAGATVFTTGDPAAAGARAKASVAALAPPVVQGTPVICEAGARSPCATQGRLPAGQVDPRGCPAQPTSGYREVHFRVEVPVLQAGRRPYTERGGELVPEGDGYAVLASESLCVSLSLPDGDPPADGWPLVLYGHGTGGNFRTGVTRLGAALAGLTDDGVAHPVALLGFDQPMHGPRQGDPGGQPPGPLFFNASNPRASKGNVIQGAADLFALERFVRDGRLDVPGLGAVPFDAGNLFYRGHSQGGTHGPIFLPYSDGVRAAALSGTAGSLVFGLLGKTKPYDSTVGLRLMLQQLQVDETSPPLHLFQLAFEPTDALVYGPLFYARPAGAPKHVLQIYGRGDHFTPDVGQRAFAAATGLTLLLPEDRPADFDLIEDLEVRRSVPPLAGNRMIEGVGYTAAVVEFDPDVSYDGHFVAQQHPDAVAALLGFLTDLVASRTPRLD